VQNPVWLELVKILGEDFLSDYRRTPGHFPLLTNKEDIPPDEMSEIRSMADLLNTNTFCNYRDVTHLYKEIHPEKDAPSIPSKITEAFRTLFLIEINLRLQIIYRVYLSTGHSDSDLSHRQKIEPLYEVEHLAYMLLNVFNLETMFEWLASEDPQLEIEKCLRDLSNFAFHANVVSFRLTKHCNISCRHCYNFSGPHNDKLGIDLNKMVQIIREMPKVHLRHVVFSGGEPFLRLDALLRLIKEAREQKINTISIFTNGSWAKSEKEARKILENLKEAGFMNNGHHTDYIVPSAGVFHQEFIPLQSIMNLCKMYYEVYQKPIKVLCEHFDNSLDYKLNLFHEILRNNLNEKVRVLFREVYPIGRAKQLSEEFSLRHSTRFPRCRGINMIVFDPDGSAKPCCGMNANVNGINIGSIYKDDLSTLIKNMQNNPILQFLSKNPMEKIFDYLEEPPNPHGYTGDCSLCEHVLGSSDNVEPLKQKLSTLQDFYPFWFSKEKLLLC
jgi:sulfatase maturation enzyme AslB (radical SAM superfamily)